ncbi:SDR family oxidoreductase [Roseococcus sp. YIM B11640]|uniref:SDR family oxidoreductase n=1 Tax=Roseococcus sp. YIM B11640 TaxID=3133973 RepID=UPI003C7C3AE6
MSQVEERQRAIQRQVKEADAKRPKEKPQGAMQAGAREYPEPPFPDQLLDKPGLEKDQKLQPMYDAPYWKGSGKLEGMRAIVTGGDSGIGRAVAVLFAREGADVCIMHLPGEQADADKTCEAIRGEGRKAHSIAGDVTDRAFCFSAVEQAAGALGGVDILVNNAAFQLHVGQFEDLTEDHFDLTLKTNLYGYFHMTQACIPRMKPGSSIVNSGSVTGLMGSPAIVDYSMTKGGIHAFTRALSGALIARGIRVNAVAPGPVWTPLNPSDDAEKAKHFGEGTPMKRPAQPEELAPAYVFLASPQMSSYITGEILPVIGGYGAH